jgi:hypothetical protein
MRIPVPIRAGIFFYNTIFCYSVICLLFFPDVFFTLNVFGIDFELLLATKRNIKPGNHES